MDFLYTYFDDEVREGFYISGIMKRMWAAQLEVYLDVVKICEKHHIHWFADYGTLLGAIRHGGYIPWDDDFDICMLRDDYMRFIEIVQDELPDYYVVKNCHTTYNDLLTRIDNNRVPCFDDDFLKKFHNCYLIAGIDVFPLDYMAPTSEEEQAHKLLVQSILGFEAILKDENLNKDEIDDVLNQLEQLSGVSFNREDELVLQMYQAVEAACAIYDADKSDRVMLAAIWAANGGKTYPLSCFKESLQMPFESIKIPVSAEYDTMLRIEYGDYMKIVKGGASHEYPCFEEQEKYVMDHVAEYPFLYKYNPDDLKEVKRLPGKKPGKQTVRFVELMRKAHNQIKDAVCSGNFESAFKMFESCQNAAIGIGTMLEENYGEGFASVLVLEDYCETLYQGSVALSEYVSYQSQEGEHFGKEAVPAGIYDSLENQMDTFTESVAANVHDRKEILIIPYRASTWTAIESVWKTAYDDSACDVYVILPPFYERTGAGGFSTMHDESCELPDYVEVTPYDTYDFENRHPDVIYIQNPYDQCNYTTSVHPFFYSKNLKKYTDKLVYIPYFTMDEINLDNGKIYQTMQYFCTVPGLFHADEVILQSEQTREAYIERLTEFAGEETRSLWEKKIVVLGSPVDDVVYTDRIIRQKQIYEKLPDAWKQLIVDGEGNKKNIVLYDITAASFVQCGENAVNKLKQTLRIFEANQDKYLLIWRQNKAVIDMLSATDKTLSQKYLCILDEYRNSGWGIYDDKLSYEEQALLADAYYGDSGYVARHIATLGKAVMIHDVEPLQDIDMVEKVELRLDCNGEIPFHIRACVRAKEYIYFMPDEINLLCRYDLSKGKVEMLGSIPDENINAVKLFSRLEYYNGKVLLIPFNAKTPWIYDIESGSWNRISIKNQEQMRKFSTSEIFNDKLYMFSNWYKLIVCIDLNTYSVRYISNIYKDYKELNVHEHCAFISRYVRLGNMLYIPEWHTNLILEFNLENEDYEWKFVGNKKIQYNAITWYGEYFYLVPKCNDSIVRWDGHNEFKEYELPKECQFIMDGLVGANAIDGKIIMQGFQCNTVVLDIDNPDHMIMKRDKYININKYNENSYSCHDLDSNTFIFYDCGETYRFDCKFISNELKSFVDKEVENGNAGIRGGIINEDDVIGLWYLLACMTGEETDGKEIGDSNIGFKIHKHVMAKRQIVLMPYKASMWDSHESIWMAARADSTCEVFVVPIPYYDKNGLGELTDYHYEGDKFPEYVPITDYREYNLEMRKPDVIYIHNPYDQGNHVTSIDPAYYSSELKKYTDTLVYVPYYATSGGMSEGQSLCRAYLYADYIVIQAERHKRFFDSGIPQEKLLALGSPKFDRVARLCSNPPAPPEEWRDKLEGRKVYLYNTSLHGMLDATNAFLLKMEYVFKSFEGRCDACLIWRPHPLFETTIDSLRAEYRNRYDELKRYFIEHEIGIYDTTPDIEKTIALCDAYIGDSGTSVTSLFGIAGKPLFILNNAIHREPGEGDWRGEIVTPFYSQGQDEWKITQGNKLYHATNRDYRYQYYCDLSDYSVGGYYRLAIERNGKVYVFPANAQDIPVIEDRKIIRRIELDRTTEQPGAFATVLLKDNYAFLIPSKYRYIVRFNINTEEADYIDGCREFIAVQGEGGLRIGGSAIWNNYLLIASPTDKRVIAIDCETLSLQVLCVDAKHYRGACAVVADGDDVWLLPSTGTNVIRWTPATGNTVEYNCRVKGFSCNRRPQGNVCLERAFGSLVTMDDKVILAPFWGNQFVQIDKGTGEVKAFDIDISTDYHENESYQPSGSQGNFIRKTDDKHVLFFHEMNHTLYEVDLKTGKTEEICIDFEEQELILHESGFSKLSEWLRYGCMENAFCSLKRFLDENTVGHAFDRESQLAAFGEIVANGDGSCGEKVHEYVMKHLK